MPTKRKVLRKKILTVRVTSEEYRKVTRRAKEDGMDRAEWLRQKWELTFVQPANGIDTKAAA